MSDGERDDAPLDLDAVRERLETRLATLLVESADGAPGGETVELDQTRVGRLSRMDALQGQAMARASEARRRGAITATRAALARLEAGAYGDCIDCEEPIDRRRLAHDPAAARCVACAQKVEG